MGRGGGQPASSEWLQEAQTLALVLKAGALPAPVTTGEIRQVGAIAGRRADQEGQPRGAAWAWRWWCSSWRSTTSVAGLIADVALLLNGLLILAGLALFNATLTLPGIAGFVLTLGIAVDANVLINERIREELRARQDGARRRWTRATTARSGPSSTRTSPR